MLQDGKSKLGEKSKRTEELVCFLCHRNASFGAVVDLKTYVYLSEEAQVDYIIHREESGFNSAQTSSMRRSHFTKLVSQALNYPASSLFYSMQVHPECLDQSISDQNG